MGRGAAAWAMSLTVLRVGISEHPDNTVTFSLVMSMHAKVHLMYVYPTLCLYSSRIAYAYDNVFFVLPVTVVNVRSIALWIPVMTLSICLSQSLPTPFIYNPTLFIRLAKCMDTLGSDLSPHLLLDYLFDCTPHVTPHQY